MRIVVLLLALSLLVMPALAFAADEGTAGIQPVPPHEFVGKVDKAVDAVYRSAQPLADGLGKVMLAAGGIVALLVLISGLSLLKRVVWAALAVGLGLLLFYNAPLIVAVIKGASAWFAGQ
ncbi:MAG: hypothetical protein ACUVSK_07285 [Desulfotomaculales bacterium]